MLAYSLKMIAAVSLLFNCLNGISQSLVPPTGSECHECTTGFFTSVTQLTDVKKSDAHYKSLLSLMDKYAVDVCACNEKTFGGNKTLTNAMVLATLNTALDRMMNAIDMMSSSMKEEYRASFEAQLRTNRFDVYEHTFSRMSDIKDVAPSACYYQHAQSLLERYSIDITNKAGLLAADKPADGKMLATLLKDVMNLTAFKPTKYTKQIITKAEFMMMMHSALDEYHGNIEKAAKNAGTGK